MSQGMDGYGAHRCLICGRTYSRKEHLTRHSIIHTKRRPFVCTNCGSTFTRRDVHARHRAICKEPGGCETPSPAEQRRDQVIEETRWEDGCGITDHASTLSPMEACFLRFERAMLPDAIQNDIPDSLEFFVRVTTTQGLAESFDPDLSPQMARTTTAGPVLSSFPKSAIDDWPKDLSIFMLDNSADIECMKTLFDGWYETETDAVLREPSAASELLPVASLQMVTDTIKPSSLCPHILEGDGSLLDVGPMGFTPDPLAVQSDEIVQRLRDSILRKPRNSDIGLQWSPELEKTCAEFFSPNNLRRFTSLYLLTWYIHWPVIHKSTFDACETPCTLLAAMTLIGASYSTSLQDRACARTWCDSVEEMVFTDEYFGDSVPNSVLNAACLETRLRALQAAHAMCLYQAWEGSDRGKRRARRHRFGQVVAMARELGFAHATHGNLASLEEWSFDWKAFVLKEELIRTLNYMVVLDAGFIIMNRMPPRVFISELHADLACPEACFQATSASECFRYLKAWLSHPLAKGGRMSLLDAVHRLADKDMGWEDLQVFTHLGDLNLGFLALAIQSVISQIRSSIEGKGHSLSVLKNWLRNWRTIWALRKLARPTEAFGTPLPPREIPQNQAERWRSAGFMKDAAQFWLIAQILLDTVEAGEAQSDLGFFAMKPADFDQTSMTYLKSLLKAYEHRKR